MKIEEGMYCYNKCNRELGIGKILTEPSVHNNVGIIYKHGHAPVVSVGNVIASHSIIDLIEVGDIVTTKHLGLKKEYIEVIDNETSLEILKSYFKEKSLELISVVTKQQFESMQYEVE